MDFAVDEEKLTHREEELPLLVNGPRAGAWEKGAGNFTVTELPLYPFVGEGEHVALVVEKTGIATRELAVSVAKALSLKPMDVGYAGMKDKDTVAVQAFTVYTTREEAVVKAFQGAGARVVSVTRHKNKLRLGHLAGNAFRLFIRGGDAGRALETLETLKKCGAPNYYGPQRFGAQGENPLLGWKVLTGNKRLDRWKRDFAVSALQSHIFNLVLAQRIRRGLFGSVLAGDVLQKTDSGGIFVSEGPQIDLPRYLAGEIVPTGPMHGGKMKEPTGEAKLMEEEVLASLGLSSALFGRETGTRRPLVFHPQGIGVEAAENGIWLSFAAPPGSYATSVVREIAQTGGVRE